MSRSALFDFHPGLDAGQDVAIPDHGSAARAAHVVLGRAVEGDVRKYREDCLGHFVSLEGRMPCGRSCPTVKRVARSAMCHQMPLEIVRSDQDGVRSGNGRPGADLPLGRRTDPVATTRKRIEKANALTFAWREMIFEGLTRNCVTLRLSIDWQPEVDVAVDNDRLCSRGRYVRHSSLRSCPGILA